MIMFREEFKENIKNEFIRYDETIKNMKDLIETIIKLDDQLYEKVMNKRFISNNKTRLYLEQYRKK